MPTPLVTADHVEHALRAVRQAKPVTASPLLDLKALRRDLITEGWADDAQARAAFLHRWLEDVVQRRLATLRDRQEGEGPAPRSTSDERVQLLCEDFAAQDVEREVWGLLDVRFFSGSHLTLRQLCGRVGVAERTLRRRMRRGFGALAELLNEREAETASIATHSLPTEATPFVGREQELAAVRRLLPEHRLVTLTGPGGIGKSRLALRLAHDLAGAFADGARAVELSALDEGPQVAEAVLQALDLQPQRDRTHLEVIVDHLRSCSLLLVLDNCEHLIAAGAELIEQILEGAGDIQFLVTSRIALPLARGALFTVPPMALPAEDEPLTAMRVRHFDAVRLFSGRAAARSPGFLVDDDTAGPIVSICRRLEGLPLALELAAGRLPETPLVQLREQLFARIRPLTTDSTPARRSHESLAAVWAWSFGLLDEPARTLLPRLSVFEGGWSEAAAARVCSDEAVPAKEVPNALAQLTSRSMIARQAGAPWSDGPEEAAELSGPRYRMLETQRAFAHQRLPKAEQHLWRLRHLDEQIRLAERFADALAGPQHTAWQARVERDHRNVHAALLWARDAGHAEAVARLGAALQNFWIDTGRHREGLRLLRDFAREEAESIASEAGAGTLATVARMTSADGNPTAATAFERRALALRRRIGDRRGEHRSLHGLANFAYARGEFEEAEALFRQALVIQRELGDTAYMAGTLHNLGAMAIRRGGSDEARSLIEEAKSIWLEQEDHHRVATSLQTLSLIERMQGKPEVALRLARASHETADRIGDRVGMLYAAHAISSAAEDLGDWPVARRSLEEQLRISRELGLAEPHLASLHNLVNLALHLGDLDGADSRLDEARGISIEHGYTYSLTSNHLLRAKIVERRGQEGQAREHFGAALRLSAEHGFEPYALSAVYGAARVALASEDPRTAATLLYGSDAIRAKQGGQLDLTDRDPRERCETRLRELLSETEHATARSTGEALGLEGLTEHALEVLGPAKSAAADSSKVHQDND